MLVEDAKKILSKCTDEEKERFALIGILYGAIMFEQLLSCSCESKKDKCNRHDDR